MTAPLLKSYRRLARLKTFQERFEYLKLTGKVGDETFGVDRYINQKFYRSAEWLRVREAVILRDSACDLGILDFPIHGMIVVHHMNPIAMDDLKAGSELVIDMNNLVCVSTETHLAIHYGDARVPREDYKPRTPGDTVPWRKENSNGQTQTAGRERSPKRRT